MQDRSYYSVWASLAYVTLFVLVNFCGNQAVVELEPAGVLYVCSERALRVKCNSTAYLLEWRILDNHRVITRSFQVDGIRTMATPISVNSTTLNVSRSLPLVSTIFTDNTTADFNGTVITCSEQAINATTLSSASVQIILVGNIGGSVNIVPHMNISAQWFETNSIIVALDWAYKNGASYNVSVDPELAINYTGRSSAQLSLSYNIQYNVSITASLCGRNSTTFSALNYLMCPPAQSVSDDSVRVSSYRYPAIKGTTITFSCPDGSILTGSNTSTCMRNGEWEPELKGIGCKANCGDPSPPSDGYLELYTRTSEGAKVNRVHVCQNQQLAIDVIVCSLDGEWETVNGSSCSGFGHESMVSFLASISGLLGSLLAVALLVCGILIMVIAIISRKKGTEVSSLGEQKNGQSKHQNSEYEEVMASRNEAACDEPEELEMMQNVAYGPLQLR